MRVDELPLLLVIDASVGLKWVVDEEGSDLAVALIAGRLLVTPALFWVEAANALASKSRRGELEPADVDDAWRDLARAPLETASLDAVAVQAALALAVALRHPIDDCCYLALALARDTQMVTGDQRFLRLVGPHATLSRHVVGLRDVRL